VPLKAAQLLEAEMKIGRIEKSAKNFRLLSQAWSLAREDARSVEPLKKAAQLDDDGELFVRLANAYLQLGEYERCVQAAKTGIKKGGLRNPDYAEISLGMCLYNAHEYRAAIRAFRRAEEAPRSTATARQWIRVAEIDMRRIEEIEKAEALANQRIKALDERRRLGDRS
jgi:tetratricopeptide (TPR) repeat protein